MKNSRQEAILDLISSRDIETQEELVQIERVYQRIVVRFFVCEILVAQRHLCDLYLFRLRFE